MKGVALTDVAPILPSRDLSATAAFYGAVEETDYGLRDFAVVDPDGNLLRIGSPVADPR